MGGNAYRRAQTGGHAEDRGARKLGAALVRRLKYPISPVLGHELEFEVEKGFDFHQSLLILLPSLLLLGSVYQGGLATREESNMFVTILC